MQFKLTPNIFKAMFNDPNLLSGQDIDIQSSILNAVKDVIYEYADKTDDERIKYNNCPDRSYRSNFEACVGMVEDYAVFILQFVSNPGGSVTVTRIPVTEKAKNLKFPTIEGEPSHMNLIDHGRLPLSKATKIVEYLRKDWLNSTATSITVSKSILASDVANVAI